MVPGGVLSAEIGDCGLTVATTISSVAELEEGMTFDVQLWTGEDPRLGSGSYLVDLSGIHDLFYTDANTALAENEVYRWRVRVVNAEGNVSRWVPASFVTGSALHAPILVSPEDREIGVPTTGQVFEWTAAQSTSGWANPMYEYQLVADTPEFGDDNPQIVPLLNLSGITGTSCGVSDGCDLELDLETNYYWRVGACDNSCSTGTASIWTRPYRFTTQTPSFVLGIWDGATNVSIKHPDNWTPDDEAREVREPILAWIETAGATHYEVRYLTDPSETAPDNATMETSGTVVTFTSADFLADISTKLTDPNLFDQVIVTDLTSGSGTPIGVYLTSLSSDERYWWQVRALDAGGFAVGTWSEPWHFDTEKNRIVTYYYVKDHLGSVRSTVNDESEVVHYSDYYPFGLEMPGRVRNADAPKERYTGHELDDESGFYYAQARYLDPVIGRWLAVDPLTQYHSSFVYSGNRPLVVSDRNGLKGDYYTEDGTYLGSDGLDDDRVYVTTSVSFNYANVLAAGSGVDLITANETTGATYLGTTREVFHTADPITNNRIALLHPAIRWQAAGLVNDAADQMGIALRVTDGTRSFQEQEDLYAQGRNGDPGPIVTNARGGQSYHNYGLAIAVGRLDAELYDINWGDLARLARSRGFEWGGDFINIDRPHFQRTFGHNWRVLYERVSEGNVNNGYVNVK